MRVRRFGILFIAAFILLVGSIAATAGAAPGGNGKGRGNHGTKNAHASAQPTNSSHDPSNPDGTYRGKSSSTPDQDGIGADHGLVNNDKTGPGTDGNNGCGNDPDREDDNNGWCGHKPAPVTPTPTPTVAPSTTPTSGTNGTEVLGEKFTRSPQVLGRALARTGAAIGLFLLASLGLVSFGYAIRAVARPRKTNA